MSAAATTLITLSPEELAQLLERAAAKAVELSAGKGPEVLTREEVAELLRVDPVTVTKYVRGRGLPGVQLGREWRFRRSQVLAWLSTQSKGAR